MRDCLLYDYVMKLIYHMIHFHSTLYNYKCLKPKYHLSDELPVVVASVHLIFQNAHKLVNFAHYHSISITVPIMFAGQGGGWGWGWNQTLEVIAGYCSGG